MKLFRKLVRKKIEHAQYNIYDIQCPICGKYKQIKMSLHSYEIGKYTKTCSSECAHKLTNQNTNREELNKKISIGVKRFAQTCTKEEYDNAYRHVIKNEKEKIKYKKDNKKEKSYRLYICQCCGKEYILDKNKEYNSIKYCSKECMLQKRHEKLSANAHLRKFGGLNPETTHKHYHRGYYNNIWCDSSWELAYVVYCKDHCINIERNYQGFEYIFNNQIFKFYPDFIVNSKFIEIKGFYTPKNIAKHEQYPNIEFIDKNIIKPYIKYASDKYGEKFWEILYEQK